MVRALPNTPWLTVDRLERIRPGFALSAALHVGLLMALAYFLAFHPPLQPQPVPVPEDPPLDYRQMPPVVPPKPVEAPTFKPILAPPIDRVPLDVSPLPLPPRENFDHKPPTVVTTPEPASPPVIINPQPVLRGGLVFPSRAEDAGMSGCVDFAFVIEPDGAVGDPEVIAETPTGYGFAAAALKAFATWRFEPKRIDGKAVAAPAQIRVSFKLK